METLYEGIIYSVKQNYRKLILNYFIMKVEEYTDVSEFTKSQTVYDAICWINAICESLRPSTAVKRFCMDGLSNLVEEVENCKTHTAE